MAGYRAYQYETSPRKTIPDYRKQRNYEKEVRRKKEEERKRREREKAKRKELLKRATAVIYISIIFGTLLVICYRNSIITIKFNEIKQLKSELATIEKENEQLEVNVESTLNLKNIEQAAKEKLGMQKLNNSQIVYVTLPKEDYIEAAAETIEKNEEKNVLEKIISYIKGE